MNGGPVDWDLNSSNSGARSQTWRFEDKEPIGFVGAADFIPMHDPRMELVTLKKSPLSGQLYPPRFTYDPTTGEALVAAERDSPPQSEVAEKQDGFSTLTLNERMPDPDTRTTIAVPPGLRTVFTAGRRDHLFALDRVGEVLFRSAHGEWRAIQHLSTPTLADPSFCVAGFDTGFATVIDDRAIICLFNDEVPEPDVMRSRVPGFHILAGPALLWNGRQVAFPVVRDQQPAVALFDTATLTWDIVHAPKETRLTEESLTRPYQSGTSHAGVYWIGQKATLALTYEFNEIGVTVLSNPNGYDTICQAPPLRDANHRIHALARGADGYAYVSLEPQPLTTPLDGFQIAAGERRYMGNRYWPDLWADDAAAQTLRFDSGSSVFVPVFTEADPRYRKGQSAFAVIVNGTSHASEIYTPQAGRLWESRAYWHSRNSLKDLGATIRLESALDIRAFRIGNSLYAGSTSSGEFHKWDLQ